MLERVEINMKVQHWCGSPGKNGWRSSPMLDFVIWIDSGEVKKLLQRTIGSR